MPSHDPSLDLRALTPSDAEAFWELRPKALVASPEAFGSSYEEEAALPLESMRARIPDGEPSAIFGIFAGEALVGIAGFLASERVKRRHKGTLWGVFVEPRWRGRGLATRLVRAVIEHAEKHVVLLQASVVTSNHAARHIYHRLGFVAYGVERKALRVDGKYHDEELLALELRWPQSDDSQNLVAGKKQ
jgi:RimJ/RimL family protein N-acetyltransferase